MPTYEYECEKCKHQFELVQSIADNALTVCPPDLCHMKKWGKGKVKRMISAGAGLIFKGSGFYITDYRSDSYKEAAKKDSAGGASEKKAEGGAKETKPAAAPKTESKTTPKKTE